MPKPAVEGLAVPDANFCYPTRLSRPLGQPGRTCLFVRELRRTAWRAAQLERWAAASHYIFWWGVA
ncbi:MAG TPA: hypothetical protein VG125_33045 [Pirellulales bacterium]|nr:hypothetical protein [Pirellulales bacterium]